MQSPHRQVWAGPETPHLRGRRGGSPENLQQTKTGTVRWFLTPQPRNCIGSTPLEKVPWMPWADRPLTNDVTHSTDCLTCGWGLGGARTGGLLVEGGLITDSSIRACLPGLSSPPGYGVADVRSGFSTTGTPAEGSGPTTRLHACTFSDKSREGDRWRGWRQGVGGVGGPQAPGADTEP